MNEKLSFSEIKEDVKNVITRNESGMTMNQIAEELSLSLDYIETILTCAQGFMEDDMEAAAHLVEMSLYNVGGRKLHRMTISTFVPLFFSL